MPWYDEVLLPVPAEGASIKCTVCTGSCPGSISTDVMDDDVCVTYPNPHIIMWEFILFWLATVKYRFLHTVIAAGCLCFWLERLSMECQK